MTAREAFVLCDRADTWERHAKACEESAESYRSRGDDANAAVFGSLARARNECAAELRADVAFLRAAGGAR